MNFGALFGSSLVSSERTVLGYALLEQTGRLEEAARSFSLDLQERGPNPAALAGLAICHRAWKDFDASIARFQAALDHAPEVAALRLEYGLALARHHRFTPLQEALQRFLAACRGPEIPPFRWSSLSEILLTTLLQGLVLESVGPQLQACLGLLAHVRERHPDAPEDRMAAALTAFIALFADDAPGTEVPLEEALKQGPGSTLDERLDALAMVLSQLRIGHASPSTLERFVAGVRRLLLPLLASPLAREGTTRARILKVLIQVRTQEIPAMLAGGTLEPDGLEPDHWLGLMVFAAPMVEAHFRHPFSQDGRDPFRSICGACFSAATPEEVFRLLRTDPSLRRQLGSMGETPINDLLFQLHQASFNLVSSGARTQGVKFAQALAAVHDVLYGSPDPFFRHGEGFLTLDWVAAFGHIVFLEILLRAEWAGFGPKMPRRIAALPSQVATPGVIPFLEANGFEFLAPDEIPEEPRRWQMDYVFTPESGVTSFMDWFNAAQARMGNVASFPCLRIPSAWRTLGQDWLTGMGISSTERVCVFHCRESTFWTNVYNAFLNARNADVQSYRPALEYLLGEGFAVFRIGDPGMTPIQGLAHPRFFDLTRTPDKPDWRDFFLLDRADLYLGTNSGPAGVANVFQTPSLLTNWSPLRVHIANLGGLNLIAPKLARDARGLLSLETLLQDPLSSSDSVDPASGLSPQSLSSEDLREATQDMVARLRGTLSPNPALADLDRTLQAVWNRFTPWPLEVPPSFLARYGASLLPSTATRGIPTPRTEEQSGMSANTAPTRTRKGAPTSADWIQAVEARPGSISEQQKALEGSQELRRALDAAVASVLHQAARKLDLPATEEAPFIDRLSAHIPTLFQVGTARAITQRLVASDANSAFFEELTGRPIRRIALAPATILVLEHLDWFLERFDQVLVGDNFKAGEVHFGVEVQTAGELVTKQEEVDLFLLTTNNPEIEADYLHRLPTEKTLSISALAHPLDLRQYARSGQGRAQRILDQIEASPNPLVVLGHKLLATAEPTFLALDGAGYDVFVLSLFDKLENQGRSGWDATCAVPRNCLVTTFEQLYILTHLKKGRFWIYYDFFHNVGWDAANSVITYARAAAMLQLASRPVVLGMYDILKPVCKNMERCPEAFALYKVMLDLADAVVLTSKSDHIAEYLRNTLVKDRPVLSFYRYSFPPETPEPRLSDLDGERHFVGVTSFLGEVFEPNRVETRNSIRSMLRQRLHFHYYSDNPRVFAFRDELPDAERAYFHIEKAIWDQFELIQDMSRFDAGWLVGDEATIFARLIGQIEDRHIRELITLFVPNGVPTSSMAYGAAGLPVFISRQIKVMDEVYPKGCCIPLDMGEVDNLSAVVARLDWAALHRTMREERHRFSAFHQTGRLKAFLDRLPSPINEDDKGRSSEVASRA